MKTFHSVLSIKTGMTFCIQPSMNPSDNWYFCQEKPYKGVPTKYYIFNAVLLSQFENYPPMVMPFRATQVWLEYFTDLANAGINIFNTAITANRVGKSGPVTGSQYIPLTAQQEVLVKNQSIFLHDIGALAARYDNTTPIESDKLSEEEQKQLRGKLEYEYEEVINGRSKKYHNVDALINHLKPQLNGITQDVAQIVEEFINKVTTSRTI